MTEHEDVKTNYCSAVEARAHDKQLLELFQRLPFN